LKKGNQAGQGRLSKKCGGERRVHPQLRSDLPQHGGRFQGVTPQFKKIPLGAVAAEGTAPGFAGSDF
jgi:hypothetical protein